MLKIIKAMLSELRKEHGKLFAQSKIENPKNMERLIEILSSFHLSSVNDDIKGLAFEHFIHSYTRGAQNDLGQYFTPRHIVRLMVQLLDPKIGEKIYDPFCGTGGMLIECFRYINQRTFDPEDLKILRQDTLFGRDLSDVARIAMMNMIMFGDGHSNIQRGNSFSMLGETKHEFDIVITNIPFSQSTDFYAGYPVVPSGEKNGDSVAVQHCLESLSQKSSSRAAIIVPIGFLYKDHVAGERRHILKNYNLQRVIELSPKCFQPYTETQTAVLLIHRKPKTHVSFIYNKVKNDGFSQDGYRVPLPGENDIDKAIDGESGIRVKIENLENNKFKKLYYIKSVDDCWELNEIAKVIAGTGRISPKTKLGDVNNGIHPIMMVADLAERHIDYCLTESSYKITDDAVLEKRPHLFPKLTTLIPTTGKASLKNHRALLGINSYATSTLTGIEARPNMIHPYCLFYYFLNFDIEHLTYDLGYPGITASTLKKCLIPNYNDKQQDEIIKKISNAIDNEIRLKKLHNEIVNCREQT